MTFTNETKLQNPAKKFISFKGSEGKFYYYDKEKETNVEVKTPIKFVLLDEFSTIKGWHDASESGIYSNEVRSTVKDTLYVRSFKGGEIVSWLYADIKGKLEGGRYAKSVYGYMDGEIVNFSFIWASLSAWIERGFSTRTITIGKDMTKGKKGTNEYLIPQFIETLPNKETIEKAGEAYNVLQEYLKEKLVEPVETVETVEEETLAVDETETEDLPF